MHAAIYLGRPDVGAICRGHPPAVVTCRLRHVAAELPRAMAWVEATFGYAGYS